MSIFQFINLTPIVYTYCKYTTGYLFGKYHLIQIHKGVVILSMDSLCDDVGLLNFKLIVNRLSIHTDHYHIKFKEVVDIPSHPSNNMVMIMMYSKIKDREDE